MKVFIYRNLNRKGIVYSLKAMDGEYKGKVLGYATYILVKDPKFVVSEKGRQRVLKERRKNVHAGVVGELVSVFEYTPRHLDLSALTCQPCNWQHIHKAATPITYNPYRHSTFYMRELGYSVLTADLASFYANDVRAGWHEKDELVSSPVA